MTLLALTEAMAIARAVATQVRRQARRQSGIHRPGTGKPRRLVLFSLPGERLVQPLGRQRGVSGARTPFAAICATLFLIADPVLRCSAGALSALCGDRGAAVSRRVGPDRFSRDPANLGRRSARALADAATFIATITLSLEWAILLGITVALLAQRFDRRRTLARQVSTVERDRFTRDIAKNVGREQGNNAGNVFCGCEPAQRNRGQHRCAAFRCQQ